MKTALLVVATGAHIQYLLPLLDSADKFFVPHDVFLWTNSSVLYIYSGIGRPGKQIEIAQEPWPGPTIHRYRNFWAASPLLLEYDQLFYCDVDMRFVAPVGEEIFSSGITATLHPGYVNERGTPETRPTCLAYCPHNTAYYCGGFNGGHAKTFLKMSEELKINIDLDAESGVTAIWHDESHLNRYLADNPPAKVLDPSYCYPENAGPHYLDKWRAAGINPTPKIIALEKGRW